MTTANPISAHAKPARGYGSRERTAWAFVAPALIAIGLFFAIPVAAALLLSLTDFDIYALANLDNLRFVGLQNYERLMSNPLFWGAMKNTLTFAVLGVPLSIAASLAAAVILNARVVKWRPIWRVMFFAPYVTTLVATAVVWRYLLHTRYGVINWALQGVGLPAVDWLGQPETSIPAILMFVVWKIFGYTMLIFLAVLQTVPDDLYEAARIDGAGPWKQFRHVTLPAIAPTMLLVSIISVASFFQLFAEPYVMTQGGPAQSTVTVLYFMYEEGFKWWNLGSASAVAFILFVCILAITLVQLAVAKRVGAYQ
ncbi:carbohydrate ABC transporter permease [Brevundimonas nasdae]|uniref:Sugar ABC transporter permease n=1 Tax=Brevundimonas nasdae TaxID=172043 RepID=A0ABX8TN63_9CAUL|nr:sugar ABC transporter permease [Brevundimonas nasdae]QYC11265.1 sugar ABC transporter permease [Brevundimonas nasdae]QYC14052.1 sugar ABC transporter permease [Brevundimonas nasdae]